MTSYVLADYMQTTGLCMKCSCSSPGCFITKEVCLATYKLTRRNGNAYAIWKKAIAKRYLEPVWSKDVHR